MCGVIHTIPVVIDNSEEIPSSEELRYINNREGGKIRYLESGDQGRSRYFNEGRYFNSDDEGRSRYINNEDEVRRSYLHNGDEGRPRYFDDGDEESPKPRFIDDEDVIPRYLTPDGKDAWPDSILLPGFLALQASDLAGYMVSNMAFKLTKALLYILWL